MTPEVNLLDPYGSFADLERACAVFCAQINARVHRVTQQAPEVMVAEERQSSHQFRSQSVARRALRCSFGDAAR